ncbi:MAG: protein-export chaperone SecB [Holosporaceae bacterium]|nr:protein-export chaperone SecB [Holosporaceae bacterium]
MTEKSEEEVNWGVGWGGGGCFYNRLVASAAVSNLRCRIVFCIINQSKRVGVFMAGENSQTFGVVAQYIKDLSFENICLAKESEASDKQPQIDVQLKVNIEKGKESDIFHVSLMAKIDAKLHKPLFLLELNYVGEFIVKEFPDDVMDAILYVECPRLLFPFARSIIASTVSEGGFPPLYLAPVNFADLYQQQKEAKNQTLQ